MSEEYQYKIERLLSKISMSYKEEQYIIPQDLGPLPNRDVIIEISKLLRQLIFPGYFGKKSFESEAQIYHVGQLITVIFEKLSEQIAYALKHQENRQSFFNDENIKHSASQICLIFLDKIPEIRAKLATDVQAAFDGDPAAMNKDEIIFSYPGILATSLHRIAHELYELNVPFIPRILSEYAHSITGIDIHPGATIGNYFFIDHGTGVVIGETTHIGNNVKIYQGVTLGALSTRGGQTLKGVKRHPTLEDDVTVYSGASILGGETVVGSSAVIASNVFVTKSIPKGTKVSIKSPELMFKDKKPQEFVLDWVI